MSLIQAILRRPKKFRLKVSVYRNFTQKCEFSFLYLLNIRKFGVLPIAKSSKRKAFLISETGIENCFEFVITPTERRQVTATSHRIFNSSPNIPRESHFTGKFYITCLTCPRFERAHKLNAGICRHTLCSTNL